MGKQPGLAAEPIRMRTERKFVSIANGHRW